MKKSLIAVLLLSAMVASAATGNGQGLEFDLSKELGSPVILLVKLFNGNEKLTAIEIRTIKKTPYACQFSAINNSLYGKLSITKSGGILLPVLELATKSATPEKLRLEVSLCVAGTVDSRDFFYWNGSNLWHSPKVQTTDHEEKSLYEKFPLSALFTANNGIALGLNPVSLVSYLGFKYCPADSKLLCVLRPVVFPGKTTSLKFVVFRFDPAFGKYSAVQKYYDNFPETFRPAKNIDPRIYSGCAVCVDPVSYDPSWKKNGKDATFSFQERLRRGGGQWHWYYAPYFIGGDFTGEYVGKYRISKRMTKKYGRMATDKEYYLKQKKDFYNVDRNINTAVLHYIMTYGEERFMKQFFPDAIQYREDDILRPYGFWIKDWGHRWGRTFRIFPWDPKWRKKAMRDIDFIFSEYPNAGISWDTTDHYGNLYRGKGIEDTGAVSWDKKGLYCNDADAAALLARYISGKKNHCGYNAAIIANGGINYPLCFNVDGFILERGLYGILYMLSDKSCASIEKRRLLWGGKIISQYHLGLRNGLGLYIDYNDKTPGELESICFDLSKYAVLFLLRFGILASPDFVNGYEYIMKYQSWLRKLVRAGWQPVTAMKGNNKLWYSRYGHELGAYFCIGNPEIACSNQKIRILNNWVGKDGQYIPFEVVEQSVFESEVKPGETSFILKLGKYEPKILQALMAVKTDKPLSLKASYKSDCRQIDERLNISGQGKVRLLCLVPEDFDFTGATFNGKKIIPAHRMPQKLEFILSLTENNSNCFSIKFKSKFFLSKEESILQYPFVADGTPRATIVIPSRSNGIDYALARQLQEYFRYYYAFQNRNIIIPIMEKASIGSMKNIIAVGNFPETPPGIKVFPGNVLSIHYRNKNDANQELYRLFYVLDKRYKVVGHITYTNKYNYRNRHKMTTELLDKLNNARIPYIRIKKLAPENIDSGRK